jgi:hypothetical protein
MVFHPPGIVLEIVGTEAGDQGCTCKEHTINCGEVLEQDVVVHLWKVQVVVDGREETAIAAIWVTEGINRCSVGFLKHPMVQHAACFDGGLAQVTHVFSSDPGSCDSAEHQMYHHNRGCCLATIISCLPVVSSVKDEGKDNDDKEMAKRKHDG